jgi:hypothetical protein
MPIKKRNIQHGFKIKILAWRSTVKNVWSNTKKNLHHLQNPDQKRKQRNQRQSSVIKEAGGAAIRGGEGKAVV